MLRGERKPVVQLALGLEMWTFELGEFTDFWLTILDEGRKTTSAYLEHLRRLPGHSGKDDRLAHARIRKPKGDGS